MRSTLLAAVLCIAAFSSPSHSAVFGWNGASGLLPSDTSPPFSLVDTAIPESPALSNGVLTIGDDVNSETMYCVASGIVPDQLVITFSMRFVSGASSVSYRTGANVFFTIQSGVGNGLFIGQDALFLLSGPDTVGSQTTAFDTDGAFHTYRIEVNGRATGSTVSVWQDNGPTPILTGSTFTSIATNGTAPRAAFGEGSELARGVSEWQAFNTNITAVPEAGTGLLFVAGLLALALGKRSTFR